MSTFTDLEKDAASVDGFVNGSGLIPTRRNGPKPSYQYLVDEIRKSRGFRVVGKFADGFTYELFNDVGIDADGNSWIYVGAGAPNKVVSAGTVPSVSAGYEQVAFNALQNLVGLDQPSGLDNVYARFFDNISAMKNANGLLAGQTLKVKGYVSDGDGGGGEFVIKTTGSDNSVTEFSLLGGLYAHRVYDELLVSFAGGIDEDFSVLQARLESAFDEGTRCKVAEGQTIYQRTSRTQSKGLEYVNCGAVKCDGAFQIANNVTVTGFAWYQSESGVVDGQDNDIVSFIRWGANCGLVRCIGGTFKNFRSQTNHQCIEVSQQGCQIQIHDLDFKNLWSLPADNNPDPDPFWQGVTRGVLVRAFNSPTNPSCGFISNIHGDSILSSQDSDLVAVVLYNQSDELDLTISNISGIDVGKRLVKVVASGVCVDTAHSKTKNITSPMWSCVSAYGYDNTVTNVSATGNVRFGCDVIGSCDVDGVKYRTTISESLGQPTGSAAVATVSGNELISVNVSNVDGDGGEFLVMFKGITGSTKKITLRCGIKGGSKSESLLVDIDNPVELIEIKNSSFTGSGTSSPINIRQSGTNKIEKISITGSRVDAAGYFSGVSIAGCNTVFADDMDGEHYTSEFISINNAVKSKINEIRGDANQNTAHVINMISCNSSVIREIFAEGGEKNVRIQDCNTVVINDIYRFGNTPSVTQSGTNSNVTIGTELYQM